MNCAQLLRKANDLKAEISEGHGDPWVTRQSLQEIYQQILLADLEYALDKKVEQDLWNHVFKNQVSALQRKAKDKTNPRRNEVQAMLTFILDSASGFYLQLLQELCSAFTLDIPCRVRTTQLGMGIEEKNNSAYHKTIIPQHSSCLYICQHCLVHLGDLARYRNETSQAESYYLHAANLVPTNGQPYNQLAIVAASKADQLAMTFYYIRSIAVKHPFPAAATNLQTTFAKLVDRDEVKLFKMKEVELIHFFIKFHAIIYLAMGEQDLQIASAIKDKLEENFRSHLAQDTLTPRQLVQISAINLFALNSIRQDPGGGGSGGKKANGGGVGGGEVVQDGSYSADEKLSWSLTLSLTLSLLQLMLNYMPTKADDYNLMWPGLPATKVLLDWMTKQPAIFTDPVLISKSMIWGKLARVLNMLQPDESPGNMLPSYKPLPEDTSLRGFVPLNEAHSIIKFSLTKKQKLTEDEEMAERASQLVAHGRTLVDHYPSLLKIEQTDETGHVTFSSPAGDDTTKRAHHLKQKQPKPMQQQQQPQQQQPPQQQQQRVKSEKSVTIIDPVKSPQESGRGGTSKSTTPTKSGSRTPTIAANLKGSGGKKARDRRDSDGMGYGERERSSGKERGRKEGRRGDSSSENRTQSVAVQAILPRQKPSPDDSSSSKKARQPSPHQEMQTPSPVLHEQNPMQPMPQYPLQPGYGGPPPSAHHPTGPPPPIQHPWQGPGPGPPPSYPPPPIHSGPPPQHPPYPPYMPPPNFPRGPPPPLPPPQRPPGEAPWQHKPSEQPPHQIPPPPPQQQQPREGHNYDYQQQRNPDEWPKHLPMPTHGGAPPPDRPPPPINPSHNQPPPHIWGGDGRPLPDQDHIARQQDMQRYGDTSPLEDRFQTSVGKSGHDFQQPTSSRPMGTQQQVPPHPGQYPQHPPPPFNIPPPQPSQDKTPSKYPQQQEMSSGDLDTPSLLELLVKMQSQPPPQNPNFPNDVGGSSMIPDRSIQSEALKTLAIGLGLQSPDKTFPPPPDYSQYEALLKSIQSSSQDTNPNPQSFAGLAKNQPPTSSSLHFGSDFELKRMQQQQQQQQQQQSPFKTSLEQNPSSSSQPRLPPGLSGLEDVQGRRMNSSPFENRSTSLFSHPQQQKPAEPMQGTAAEWRQTDQLRRGMTGGGSHLFPTREEHQDRRGGGGGAGGELPSWLDKSAFGSVAGERRTRQQETPTLLMPENDSFGLSPSPTKGMGSGSMGSGSMGSFLGQDRGDGLGSRMHGRSSGSTYGNIAENRSSSLFPSAEKRKSSLEDVSFNSPAGGPGSGGASGSYSLFSYSSPWSGSKEGLNLSSSPFSSSPSSPRSQSPSIQYSSHHQQSGGGNLLGWSPAERSTGPSWSRGHQLSSSPTSGLLPENLQSIWSSPMSSSEASPLEQLLKNQRQRDHDT